MKNRQFHFLLRSLRTDTGERLTVGRIAEEIYVSRPRLNDVLNNTPGHGGRTRTKVVKFFEKNLPQHKAELLAALGWVLADGHYAPQKRADVPHRNRYTWNNPIIP